MMRQLCPAGWVVPLGDAVKGCDEGALHVERIEHKWWGGNGEIYGAFLVAGLGRISQLPDLG